MTRGEFSTRLEDRARALGMDVPARAVAPLAAYFELLARWNARINLTALPLDPPTDAALDRLFLEPLAAAIHVPTSPLVWFDLGSGGGSPAVPIRVLRPAARLTLVESKARKAAFLRETVRVLELSAVAVVNERFEAFRPTGPSATVITVRAIRADPAMLQAAHALLEPGGRLLLFATADKIDGLPGLFEPAKSVPLLAQGRAMLHILVSVPRGT